jgi:uncharacterized membrane protein YcaP (DUF421 family)
MDAVLRAAAIYFFLLALFRISGSRTLADATAFDLVLLLIVAEATQQALVGTDYSVTAAVLLILTLVGVDIALSFAKQRSRRLERIMDGMPVVLVEDGRALTGPMNRARVDEKDIMSAARLHQGLERLDQIKFAVLESSGGISIIPR